MCYLIYINIYKNWSVTFIVVTFLLSHINGYIIQLFSTSSLLPFILPIKKKLLLFLLVHIWCYTSSNLLILFPPSLPLYLLTTLYFTITPFSLSYILILLLPILFCINSISLLTFNPYFSNKKTMSTLSLSLSLWIFVLSYYFD